MLIKIEIDNENKEIKKFEIPSQLNPIQVIAILNECQRYLISKLEYKEESKIIKPELIIKNGGAK